MKLYIIDVKVCLSNLIKSSWIVIFPIKKKKQKKKKKTYNYTHKHKIFME